MDSSLRRELTLTHSTALVISNMIGTGIFTTTGFLMANLGRPWWVMGVWATGAVVAIAGCLTYAELGINFPRSGAEYVYLREAWGGAWGFLSGWISFFAGFSAPIAATALAFASYLGSFSPALLPGQLQVRLAGLHIGPGEGVAILLVALMGCINILSVRSAADLQNVLTGIKLGVLLAFLTFAWVSGKTYGSNWQKSVSGGSVHGLAAEFAISLVFVMFSYSGWNAAAYVAEEMKNVERVLPVSLAAGTGIVAILYLALNAVFITAVPPDRLKGQVDVGSIAAESLFGRAGGGVFSGMMALALVSCVGAMVLVGPRVYYAMAQDKLFFTHAARLHPVWKTPANAIVWQTIVSILMLLTGSFESLIYYIGFALILFAALAAAGLFRVRRRPGWKRLRVAGGWVPGAAGLFIVASIWMLVYTAALRPKEAFLGLLTIVGGGLVYRWRFREGS
jgi:APA family basic amino acid/polyamine antiporter